MVSVRREGRILIVQTLFEHDFHGTLSNASGLMGTFNRLAREYKPALVDSSFAQKVLRGVASKYDDINSIIAQASPDWPLDKIGSVDRNILRLGVFELLFGKEFDVPGRVALNEAIEITKVFLDDSSRKFINGVLGAIYLEVKDPNEDKYTPKKSRRKESVGGIIFRVDESGAPQFAFVYDVFGRWTLSKGGLEEQEKVEDGLRRIIRDELGIAVEPLEKVGKNAYTAHPPGGPVYKEVTYLIGETKEVVLHLKESEGLKEAKWFTYEEAKRQQFYPDLRQIILDGMHKVTELYARG